MGNPVLVEKQLGLSAVLGFLLLAAAVQVGGVLAVEVPVVVALLGAAWLGLAAWLQLGVLLLLVGMLPPVELLLLVVPVLPVVLLWLGR